VVELKEYWADMPIKRSSTFRHLALEHAGAGACVNECVVARVHDRALPLRLRMFMKENANKKGFAMSAGAENREPAANWEAPKSIIEVQAALVNLADVFAALWPLDPTPRILSRILVTYDFGSGHAGAEKDRSRWLEEFCDAILRENARRAVTVGYPLSYQQARERWRDLAELKRASQPKVTTPAVNRQEQQGQARSLVSGGTGRGAGPPRGNQAAEWEPDGGRLSGLMET
jgi:hypothetical protein